MLWAIFVVLLLLWALGKVTSTTMSAREGAATEIEAFEKDAG